MELDEKHTAAEMVETAARLCRGSGNSFNLYPMPRHVVHHKSRVCLCLCLPASAHHGYRLLRGTLHSFTTAHLVVIFISGTSCQALALL